MPKRLSDNEFQICEAASRGNLKISAADVESLRLLTHEGSPNLKTISSCSD